MSANFWYDNNGIMTSRTGSSSNVGLFDNVPSMNRVCAASAVKADETCLLWGGGGTEQSIMTKLVQLFLDDAAAAYVHRR